MQIKSFENQIDNLILRSLQNGVQNFNGLVCALPGVYPTEIHRSLIRLQSPPNPFSADIKNIIWQMESQNSGIMPIENEIDLPAPHPLDFDWRFSEAGLNVIVKKINQILKPKECFIIVGSPTLALKAREYRFAPNVFVLDRNVSLLNRLREKVSNVEFISCDIARDSLPNLPKADVIVVDPPWYPEFIYTFLWACSFYCSIGGYILLSFPSKGTRPGIEKDKKNLMKYSDHIGLELVKIEPEILTYKSPLFEKNALFAENIYLETNEWRKADLFTFVCHGRKLSKRPVLAPCENEWREEIIGCVKIRLKNPNNSEFKDPQLISLVPRDILPSVSRREPRRDLVDVWTSGNRVFQCSGTGSLLLIIEAMKMEICPEYAFEKSFSRKLTEYEVKLIYKAYDQINSLIEIESSQFISEKQNAANYFS